MKNSLKFCIIFKVLLGWNGQQAALFLLYSTFKEKNPYDE